MQKIFSLLIIACFLNAACIQEQPKPAVETPVESPAAQKVREAKEAAEQFRQERLKKLAREASKATHMVDASALDLDRFGEGHSAAAEKAFGLPVSDAFAVTLAYFVSEPQTYSDEKSLRDNEYGDIPEVRRRARNHTRKVMVAYGILQLGNNPLDRAAIKTVVTQFFLNKEIRERAYVAAFPSIRMALASMPRQDRNDYMAIFRYMSRYMATFDMRREHRYFQSLQAGECHLDGWEIKYYRLPPWMATQDTYPCPTLFTNYGPDGRDNPYRKAEAFVYRRVLEGWDLQEMRVMLDRLLADLS